MQDAGIFPHFQSLQDPDTQSLGEICYAKGEFAAAIDQFKKAMELMARDFGDDNASYAVLADTASCASGVMSQSSLFWGPVGLPVKR